VYVLQRIVYVACLGLVLGLHPTGNRPACSQEEAAPAQITTYLMWNERFFYVGAWIQDPHVVGKRTGLMEEVWNDDDFEVFIETNRARAPAPTPHCFRLAASAAEGVSFFTGNNQDWTPCPLAIDLKFKASPRGTLNDPTDVDQGYVIELGIPWSMLGGLPRDGSVVGFNLVKYLRGETNRFFSLSPQVQTEEDLHQPFKWETLVFRKTPRLRPGEGRALKCYWTDQVPLVDGQIDRGEWNLQGTQRYRLAEELVHEAKASDLPTATPGGPRSPGSQPQPPPPPAETVEEAPLPAEAPPPAETVEEAPPPAETVEEAPPPAETVEAPPPAETVEEAPPPAEAPLPPRGPYTGENLVLAPYYYWYQGDERAGVPTGHVRGPENAPLLSTKPINGAGPWFSALRVGWHRQQLPEIREADIDVILPVYYGDTASQQTWSLPGLVSLAMALKELRAWPQEVPAEFPFVGLFFAVESLAREQGGPVDLTQPEAQELLYRMIRDFFWHVPQEFWAVVTDEGRRECIVALSSPDSLARVDESFLSYCGRRFREDFQHDLLWLGAPDWWDRGVRQLDGYVALTAGLQPDYQDRGRLSVASLGPGFNNTASPGDTPRIRSRLAGQTLKDDFQSLADKASQWLLFTDWNNFQTGSNLAPCREYGLRYLDVASYCAIQFNGGRNRDAKYVQHNTPSILPPGGLSEVEFRLTNDGFQHWVKGQGIRLAYRWYRDNHLVEEGGLRTGPLVLRRSKSTTVVATVHAARRDGTPLEEGDYELRWELVAGKAGWFSLGGDSYFSVPVKIGPVPDYAATFLRTTMFLRAEPGQTYPVSVWLRNDGARSWEGVRLGYHWERRTTDGVEVFRTEEEGLELPHVKPGAIARIATQVRVAEAEGQPLPLESEPNQRTFLCWSLRTPEGTLFPGASYRERIVLIPRDYGPAFLNYEIPAVMEAGQLTKVRVTLANSAFQTWPKEEVALSYHWYYWDGVEASWDGLRTPLPEDVPSRGRVEVEMQVLPPPYGGPYTLVPDLLFKGQIWGSLTPSTYSGDYAAIPVRVVGGLCTPVELNLYFNVDALSYDLEPGDGDFDGAGHTFPAEEMPPTDVSSVAKDLYPSGYWSPRPGTGPGSGRHIPFRYPPPVDGTNNAVACRGQKVPVPPGSYVRLHLLGAATAPDASGTLTLNYQRGTGTAEVALSPWEAPPVHGERIGYVAYHRHTPAGDDPDHKGYLHHSVIEVEASQPLQSVTLPQNEALKIMAMTLESQAP